MLVSDKYKLNIPIIRNHYNKTKSSKFKGNLSIISNRNGIICDWKITFSEIYLDLYTTKSWFNNNCCNFRRRKELFDSLNLKQEIRPKKLNIPQNKLIKLDIKQIQIVNEFLNNRDKYNSTIKNIVAILKGNNPTGEAKNPPSAEMVIDNTSHIKNFVILFDDLIMKQKIKYHSISICAQQIELEKFVKLNDSLESAFNYMQKNKDLTSWQNYLIAIKTYYTKYNKDINKACSIVKTCRNRFNKNIDKEIQNFPFGFKTKDQFQKCHIYESHNLREQIVEAIRNNKSYKKYANMIADPNNFIPLPEEIHRKFDANYFTYKLNGTIWAIHEDGFNFIKKYIQAKYKKIPKYFLNKNRQKYFSMRNNNIKNIKFKI